MIFFTLLFSLTYRKQTAFIRKNVHKDLELNDKEEIEKQMAFLKELDNKKLYYDEFFNQIHKTKTPTAN